MGLALFANCPEPPMGAPGKNSNRHTGELHGNVAAEANSGGPLRVASGTSDLPVSLNGVVDAILEVGRQRKALLDQLRSALQSGNDAEALRLARQLCGLLG